MPSQEWECEGCKCGGSVEYEKGAGVMEVVNLVEDDHMLHSPLCEVTVSAIRLKD